MKSPSETPKHVHLRSVPVDQRGHRQVFSGRVGDLRGNRLDVDIFRVAVEEPLTDGYVSVASGAFNCQTCDAHPGFEVTDSTGPLGVALRAKTTCPLPDGLTTVVSLEVPSGRIVIADHLSPVFTVPLPLAPGFNSVVGRSIHTHQMAALGCATGSATNTGPALVRPDPDEDRYVIALLAEDEEEEPRLPPRASVETRITGSVAGYAIADLDHWRARALDQGFDPDALLADDRHPISVVAVTRGVYLVHDLTGRSAPDSDLDLHDLGDATSRTYAEIIWHSPLLPSELSRSLEPVLDTEPTADPHGSPS